MIICLANVINCPNETDPQAKIQQATNISTSNIGCVFSSARSGFTSLRMSDFARHVLPRLVFARCINVSVLLVSETLTTEEKILFCFWRFRCSDEEVSFGLLRPSQQNLSSFYVTGTISPCPPPNHQRNRGDGPRRGAGGTLFWTSESSLNIDRWPGHGIRSRTKIVEMIKTDKYYISVMWHDRVQPFTGGFISTLYSWAFCSCPCISVYQKKRESEVKYCTQAKVL